MPKIEMEFSLFKLILLKYIPSKIKIIEPEIEIISLDSKASKIAINGVDYYSFEQQFLEKILQVFESLKYSNVAIKNFEIENAK